jgi:hypothetical protein
MQEIDVIRATRRFLQRRGLMGVNVLDTAEPLACLAPAPTHLGAG